MRASVSGCRSAGVTHASIVSSFVWLIAFVSLGTGWVDEMIVVVEMVRPLEIHWVADGFAMCRSSGSLE